MKLKKKLLTAAVCLALSTGHTLAMPTGGQIVTGDDNISGFVPNPESGATITFGGNGVINWDAFNIGANESLTFDVVRDALAFNYVSGADISTILGHLTQSGEGGMLLCNPNGIVVGNGAVINANDFTMMTMKLTDDQLKNVFTDGGSDILLTAGKGKDGNPALIDIQSGANFNITDKINLYGGRVAIADGVVISSEPDEINGGIKNDDIHIFAGNEMQIENGEGGPDLIKFNADKNNTINVGKVDLTANDNVSLIGGSVSLDGTNVSTKTFDAHAMSGLEHQSNSIGIDGTYTIDNVLSINNANISEEIVDNYSTGAAGGEITGGAVNISNSVIGSDLEKGGMYIGAMAADGALKISNSNMAMGEMTLVALNRADKVYVNEYTDGNDIEITNSTIAVGNSFDAHGSSITLSDNSKLSAKYGMLWAASNEQENAGKIDYHASASNEVSISNSELSFNSGFAGDDAKYNVNKLSVRGGKISVSNSEITNTGAISLKSYNDENKGNITISNSDISVTGENNSGEYEDMAVWSQGNIIIKDSQLNSNGHASVIATDNIDNYLTYGADNKIAISGSSITAPGKMRIYGSSIDIMNGSSVESGNDLSIEAKAEEIKGGTEDKIEYVTKANADNILNVTADSKIKSHGIGGGTLEVIAGRATISGHLYNSKTEEEPFAYDNAAGKITILADSSAVPDPEPALPETPDVPVNPDVPVTPDVPVEPIEDIDKITEDTPVEKVVEIVQKQVNTPAQANMAISQVVALNISNEKKSDIVRTIIENVEVSAEADTHVQNMSAAVQNENSTAGVQAGAATFTNEVAGTDMVADVTVDGAEV